MGPTLPAAFPAESVSVSQRPTLADVRRLLEPRRPPCVTLTLPTHPSPPENRTDRPEFRRLVERATELLGGEPEAPRILAPLLAIGNDRDFWEHAPDGLAIFAADGLAEVFPLASLASARVTVGDRFDTLRLLQEAAAIDPVAVLALSSREASLFHMAGAFLEPIPLGGKDGSLHRIDVIDAETCEAHRVRRSTGPVGSVHGGYGTKADDTDADTERFFREVVGEVRRRLADHRNLPLLLVALSEHAGLFGRLAGGLVAEPFLPLDPQRLDAADLRRELDPILRARRARLVESRVNAFQAARARARRQTAPEPVSGDGLEDLAEIARAAVAGRVGLLLVERDRQDPGRLDRHGGRIERGAEATQSGSELIGNLVGLVAEEVLLQNGEIVLLEPAEMPTDSGLAAILRS
jgi:hypothetical protein